MRTSLILLLGCLISANTWAASVSQVKNNKLILQLDGESLSPGSEVYILNSDGKKIGLVSIKQVKGNKALGEITKGRANAGDQAQVKGASSSASASASTSGRNGRRRRGAPVGVLAGYSMNSMALTVQSPKNTALKESATLKGNSFSVKGFYDYEMSPNITVRGATGLEGFSVSGTTTQTICSDMTSTTCSVQFNYLAFEGSAHYNYLTGKTKAWVGLGYSFLLAVSKSNNIPNLSTDSATNQMILAGTGADFGLGNGSFIPVVVEYGMFPGSSNVSASAIAVRTGYGFTF